MKNKKQGTLEEILNSSVAVFLLFQTHAQKTALGSKSTVRFYPSPDARLRSHKTL